MEKLKVSLEPELRRLLDKFAGRRGVSVGEEVRYRLWRSFVIEGPLWGDYDYFRGAALYNEAWFDACDEKRS